MDIIIEKIFEMNLSNKYDEQKEILNNYINEISHSLYLFYKKRFPLHIGSQKCLKQFCKNVKSLDLLKDKERYINLNKTNEFFEINLVVDITKTLFTMRIIFPYLINIHKVNKVIKDRKMSTVKLNLSELKKLINPECFYEFDMHMQAKKEGRDVLDKIKSDNPIILMRKNGLVNDYLINGTHRTIQAIRDGRDSIEGYVVDADMCGICGFSEDYETLYWMMKELYCNVYGVDRNMKWTKYARENGTLPFH